ncbi:MAG: hypothetical protein AAFQ99_00145, partial [Pseudomonadota bacterium]
MAKQTQSNQSPLIVRVLLPVLLVAAAAVTYLASNATTGSSGAETPRDALIAVRAKQAVAGSNGALAQLESVVRESAPGGVVGEQARTILGNRERLAAFNDAAERLVSALDAMDSAIGASTESNLALPELRLGLDAIRTAHAAMRGDPAAAPEIGAQMTETATAVSRLVDALSGSNGGTLSIDDPVDDEPAFDIAVLDNSLTASILSEQMLVARGAADALASDAI